MVENGFKLGTITADDLMLATNFLTPAPRNVAIEYTFKQGIISISPESFKVSEPLWSQDLLYKKIFCLSKY